VLDFGLVKHLDAPAGQMLTIEGTTAGTPAYMAPEVALGRTDADGRADLYSLACVAYFLLTGQPLFARDTPFATALAHVHDQPNPPSTRSEFQIPPALDALILECLAKDPAARPATAEVFGRRLAQTVSSDAWTPDAARAWWELHKGSLAAAPQAGTEAAPREPPSQGRARHVWRARLDRTLDPQQDA